MSNCGKHSVPLIYHLERELSFTRTQWRKLSYQDKTWAEFSTLDLGACLGCAIVHITKQSNLKLKTLPKQLLGSLPLAFTLPTHIYT